MVQRHVVSTIKSNNTRFRSLIIMEENTRVNQWFIW